MRSRCNSISSFTEESSSATPTANHTMFCDMISTQDSDDVILLQLDDKLEEDDRQSANMLESSRRLSVSNRLAEFTKQRLLQSEQERRHASEVKELKYELIQAQEQIKAKDETIRMYAAHQRSQRLDEIMVEQRMASMQLGDESYQQTLSNHQAELKRNNDEEKQSLGRRLELMESRYSKLEKDAEEMQKRAFRAEGLMQLAEAKLSSTTCQLEYKLEESQKLNVFLQSKVSQLEHQNTDKDVKLKEREKQLETKFFEWKHKAENLEEQLDHIVSIKNTRIRELEGQLSVAFEESGQLRISLAQTERAKDDLATISHQNENEIVRLRRCIQEKDNVIQSRREEHEKRAQLIEDLQKQLLEVESRLNASNQTNDFLRSKLADFEKQKAARVPLVAKNAVLKKQLEEKEKCLDVAIETCFMQAEKLRSLESKVQTMKTSHEQTVEALNATVSTLKEEEQSLRQEIAHLQSRLDLAEGDNHTLRNTISDLESKLSASVKDVNLAQCRLNELEERKKMVEIETKEQFNDLEKRMKESLSKADLLEFQLVESETDASGRISGLESQLEEALFHIEFLEEEVACLNQQKLDMEAAHVGRVKDLENRLTRSGDEVSALSQNASMAAADAAKEMHKLQKIIAELEARYADCNFELENTKDEVAQTKALLDSNESFSSRKIEDLQHNLNSSTNTIDDLKVTLADSEAKNRDLQALVDALQLRLTDSADVANMLTDQLTEIRKTAQEQIASFKSKLTDTSQKLVETQHLLEEANKESTEKSQQILDFESQLPLINRKVFYLESEVNHAKEEVILCRNKLRNQTDEFQSKLTMERERYEKLKADENSKSEKVNELEAVMKQFQSTLDEKERELDTANKIIANQGKKTSELVNEIAEFEFQLSESERVIDSLRASLSRAESNHLGEGEKARSHLLQLRALTIDYEREVTSLRDKLVMLEEDKLRNMEHVRLLEANFM